MNYFDFWDWIDKCITPWVYRFFWFIAGIAAGYAWAYHHFA